MHTHRLEIDMAVVMRRPISYRVFGVTRVAVSAKQGTFLISK